MKDVDWGTVPQWLGLASIVVAAAVFLTGRRDSQRALPSRVFVIHSNFNIGDNASTELKIHNDGSAPIFDVSLSLFDWGYRRWGWRFRSLSNWWTGKRYVGRLYAVITPGMAVETGDIGGLTSLESSESVRPPIVLTFSAGNGRRWVRWPDGRLSRHWRIRGPRIRSMRPKASLR